MIKFDTLVDEIQYRLNHASNNSGVSFVIFTDTAKYRKALRTITNPNDYSKPLNGVATVVSNEITPNQAGVLVSSQTVRVEICVPCLPTDNTRTVDMNFANADRTGTFAEGNAEWIERVRAIIDGVTAGQWLKPFSDDDKNYTVTCAYTFANTGTRGSRLQTGDSITYSFFAYLNIIETGENSRADEFYLDGQIIPYVKANITRKQTTEGDVPQGEYAAKATSTGGLFTITLAFPSFVSAYSKIIKDFLINGESNTVHVLSGKVGFEKRTVNGHTTDVPVEFTKLMFFDTADRSAEGVMNVGMTATLVEAWDDYDLMTVPDNLVHGQAYTFSSAPANIGSSWNIRFAIPEDGKQPPVGFVFNNATGITMFDTHAYYVMQDGHPTLAGYETNNLPFTDSVTVDGTTYANGGTVVVATATPTDIVANR